MGLINPSVKVSRSTSRAQIKVVREFLNLSSIIRQRGNPQQKLEATTVAQFLNKRLRSLISEKGAAI